MLTSDFSATFNPAIIVPFYVGSLTSLFAGAVIARRLFGNQPGESVSSGFSAMFTNTVLIGIPIIQRAYGAGALPTVFSIIAFHAPGLITLGMLVMELVRRDGQPSGQDPAGRAAAHRPESAAVGRGARADRQSHRRRAPRAGRRSSP